MIALKMFLNNLYLMQNLQLKKLLKKALLISQSHSILNHNAFEIFLIML